MSRQGTKLRNFATQVIDVDVALTEAEAATADVVSNFQSFEVNDRSEPAIGTINHIMVIDKDDKGILLDILFSDKQSQPALGTNNDVVAISDADSDTIIGSVSSGETYVDLVASKVVVPSAFSPIPFSTANGKLYIGVINRGAATTWTDAAGITIRLGLTIE